MIVKQLALWFFAVAFFVMQNRYFGWNAMPQSGVELVADGITIVLIAIAVQGVA